MRVSYNVRDCLTRCINLQRQASRWGKELAIGELMRMAVLEEPSEATVIALCRMLFVSKTDEPLRRPYLGEPWFLGDTSEEDWPLDPIHLYRGVPFFVVRGWSLAGLPEHPTWYLAHCLLSGVWNEKPFRMIDPEELALLTREFLRQGPWKRPLVDGEQTFLLSQIESDARQPAGTTPPVD